MATNLPSRDPRLNRQRYNETKDHRKRLASQSPAGDARAPKRILQPEAAPNGALPRPRDRPPGGPSSRDSSISVNSRSSGDGATNARPKLPPVNGFKASSLSSRDPSTTHESMNGRIASRSSPSTIPSQGHALTVRSAGSSGPDRLAGGSTNINPDMGGSNAKRLMDMLVDAADLAIAQTAHSQAEAALNKAVREYDNTKSHFSQYPAIREQKISERTKAEERHRAASEKLRSVKQRLERQTDELAPLLTSSSSAEVASATQNTHSILQDQVDQLNSEVENLKRELQNVSSGMPAVEQVQTSVTEVKERVDALQNDVKDRSNQPTALETGRIEALQQKMQVLEDERDNQLEIIADHVDGKLKESNAAVTERIDKTYEELKTSLDQGRTVQHQNASDINACSSRLDVLGRDLAERMSRLDNLAKQVDKFGNDLKVLETKERPVQAATTNNDSLQLPQFQPVYDEPPTQELRGMQYLQSSVQALQAACADHKARLDNMTTDHIVLQMSHQMNAMYPHLKEYNHTIVKLTQNVSEIQNGLHAAVTRIDKLEKSSSAQDIAALRADLAAVQKKVDEVATQSQEQLAKFNEGMQDITKDVRNAEGMATSCFQEMTKFMEEQ